MIQNLDPNIIIQVLWEGIACYFWNRLTNFFIDDVTQDGDNRTNSEVFKIILSGNVLRNASNIIERNAIMQHDNYPKHTANTK